MSSIALALLDCLRSVERPGDFCVGGMREIFTPAIDVDGVGRIAIPLLPMQVEQLVATAGPAPYGRGEETVLDRDVRRTWQIDPHRVRIGGRHWTKTLAELVADAAHGLGVSEPVAADFYKLLVYDAGSHFIDHRDTEKVPGMFATLAIVLPSVHSGGDPHQPDQLHMRRLPRAGRVPGRSPSAAVAPEGGPEPAEPCRGKRSDRSMRS
jgi:hypothetical protein